MTLYRGMDIGTAKPTPAERGGVPHHLIDVLDPWESASVAEYRAWALAAVADDRGAGQAGPVRRRDRALSQGAAARACSTGPGPTRACGAALEEEADRRATRPCTRGCAALDPATAARLHPNDRRRVVRALEVIAATGRP